MQVHRDAQTCLQQQGKELIQHCEHRQRTVVVAVKWVVRLETLQESALPKNHALSQKGSQKAAYGTMALTRVPKK